MRTDFRILAEGTDITDKIADRLIRLSVTDEAGRRSDAARIELDDRDAAIRLPRTGAELEIWLGYESSLVRAGLYKVDRLELSAPPATLLLEATSANMKASLKEQKTRPWEATTIGAIIEAIAADHGLTPTVGDDLSGVAIDREDQLDESDMHFLSRLAIDRDAVAKPADDRLLFVRRDQAKSASGRTLPTTMLRPGDVTSWQVSITERLRYQSVVAYWHDTEAAERREVRAGSGEPTFTIASDFPDAATAQAAANARLGALARGTSELEMTMPGRADLFAEAPLTLTGFRDGVDGDWTVETVEHSLSRSGFTTRLTAKVAKAK